MSRGECGIEQRRDIETVSMRDEFDTIYKRSAAL